MNVIVLATSVQSPVQVKLLEPVLNSFAGAGNWNFALEDSDRILRIVSDEAEADEAIRLLHNSGFECCELDW